MRAIKFRAWCEKATNYALGIKKDRMIYNVVPMPAPNSEFFKIASYNVIEIVKSQTNFLSREEYNGIVMQYTGFHDKNGKEIYEGDIVKLNDDVYEIEWCREGYFGFNELPKNTDFNPAQTGVAGWEMFEVVGNFCENSELLMKEK